MTTTRLNMSSSSSSFSCYIKKNDDTRTFMCCCPFRAFTLQQNKKWWQHTWACHLPPLCALRRATTIKKQRQCGNILASLSYSCYNKTMDDDDAFKHVIVVVFFFVLCVELQETKKKRQHENVSRSLSSLCSYTATKQQMTTIHLNASSSSSLCCALKNTTQECLCVVVLFSRSYASKTIGDDNAMKKEHRKALTL
jgi:hypothetical protein